MGWGGVVWGKKNRLSGNSFTTLTPRTVDTSSARCEGVHIQTGASFIRSQRSWIHFFKEPSWIQCAINIIQEQAGKLVQFNK